MLYWEMYAESERETVHLEFHRIMLNFIYEKYFKAGKLKKLSYS